MSKENHLEQKNKHLIWVVKKLGQLEEGEQNRKRKRERDCCVPTAHICTLFLTHSLTLTHTHTDINPHTSASL